MSQSKRIILFTIGNIDHPSSRIRGIQYIPYFEDAGYRVRWVPRIPKKPKSKLEQLLFFPIKKRIYSIRRAYYLLFAKPEIFFIQKIFIPKWILQKANNGYSKIIFDFDDAIYLDKNNPSAKINTDLMIHHADEIIVSNTILADYCKEQNKQATIVTTPVDTKRIYPTGLQENPVFTIGWIGSFWTTKYLELIKEALQEIAKNHNFKLILVGADINFKIEGVNIEHLQWNFEDENKHLNLFDIGIMPLTEDEYSSAKGGYKLLMYMSAGKASVASPVGINSEIIIENKTGFLASTKKEWIDAIEFFINNREKCSTFGNTSRQIAEEKYSRDICFRKIADILE